MLRGRTVRPWVYAPNHSSIHPFIHSSIHPFIHSSIHLFIHSSIHLFIHSSIHLFIHSSIHPFVYSSIHLCINPAPFAGVSVPLIDGIIEQLECCAYP